MGFRHNSIAFPRHGALRLMILMAAFWASQMAWSQETSFLPPEASVTPHSLEPSRPSPSDEDALAQFDADETYDPFADYSEFDETADEEADINFFRNGRFVTLGFIGGMRGFTGKGLPKIYSPAPSFGLFLSYFFDLRFALQFSFTTADHNFRVSSANQKATGTVSLTAFSLDVKYYINTQNVTKGLGKFNPYLIGGFSRIGRTTHVNGVAAFGREDAPALDLGAGIELPMMRNKMFFGAQAMYQFVTFRDENTELAFDNESDKTGVYPNGDTYTLMAILGVNF